MRRWSVVGVVVAAACVLVPSVARAQHEADETKALEVAKAWLTLVDTGKFGESYDATAPFFKSQVAKEKWDAKLVNSRLPLGRVLKREVAVKQYTTDIKNAPQGEYVVVVFNTAFDGMPKAQETLTAMRQRDGGWKICGYYVKQPQK